MNAKLTIGIAAVAGALTIAASVSGAPTRASSSLQLQGTFQAPFNINGAACSPGTPADVGCYAFVGDAVVPGLGRVTERYTRTFDGNRDKPCVRTLPTAVIDVAGKGAIAAAITAPECLGLPPTRFSFSYTISGGSGAYAGASGTIEVTSAVSEGIAGQGSAVDTWSGALTVPGLEFDVTAPTLAGAVSKTVRAPKKAKGMRVRYAVTAKDAVDGSVTTACAPRSGSFFSLGRTKVNCSAVDSSGNTTTAKFSITVKR